MFPHLSSPTNLEICHFHANRRTHTMNTYQVVVSTLGNKTVKGGVVSLQLRSLSTKQRGSNPNQEQSLAQLLFPNHGQQLGKCYVIPTKTMPRSHQHELSHTIAHVLVLVRYHQRPPAGTLPGTWKILSKCILYGEESLMWDFRKTIEAFSSLLIHKMGIISPTVYLSSEGRTEHFPAWIEMEKHLNYKWSQSSASETGIFEINRSLYLQNT